MIQFVAKIISLAWAKPLNPAKVAVQCYWNLKCSIPTAISSHSSAVSCMVAKKVTKLILKFCNEFWDNSKNLISAQEDFIPQGLLNVRESCAPLANALDFKIQDSWCISQRPGSWNQGIFFVLLPIWIYISVSCKEKVEIQKLVNMKGTEMQIWRILDLFHDINGSLVLCAWPDMSFWMLEAGHPMLYFNQIRCNYDGFKKGILVVCGCRCYGTQLAFFTQIFKFISYYLQQLRPAFSSHCLTQMCQGSSFQTSPNVLCRCHGACTCMLWRHSSGASRPAEAGRPTGWQGKGRLPVPGRKHIQYMAFLLPEEIPAWHDASQNWER